MTLDVFTSVVEGAVADGSKHDAGHEDEATNQQEGEEVKNHKEPQEQEVGLHTTAKVTCRGLMKDQSSL